ncbi:unnamed protein product, partial [Discosporangium mesarthrocarpum]
DEVLDILSQLNERDAKDVGSRAKHCRQFVADNVMAQVAAGLLEAAEVQPSDTLDFLANYLIR